MFINCANATLRRSHTDITKPAPIVGLQWPRRFLNAHPEYYIQKQKMLDVAQKNSHNPDNILDWFYHKYRQVIEGKKITLADQYNFDKTGFQIGIGKDQWIITQDPSRQAYLASSQN